MTWILFGIGTVLFLATTGFAVLFHTLSGRIDTDLSDGCLGLYICLTGAAAAISCYYFAVTL